MISRSTQSTLWRWMRTTWRAALGAATLAVLAALVFRWYHGVGSLEDTRPRLLLTVIGIVVGGWLAHILAAGLRRTPKVAWAGLIAIVISQICYLTLIWSEWKPYVPLWRAWIVSLVAAAACAHFAWCRVISHGGTRWFDRATPWGGTISGAMVAALALRPNLLDETPSWYVVPLVMIASLTLVGSFILWVRHRRGRVRPTVSRWRKLAWVLSAQAAVFGSAFYLGRVTAPVAAPFDTDASPLAHLTPRELDAQLETDLVRLQVVMAGLDDLADRASGFHEKLNAARKADGRAYFLPAEEDEMRAQFMTYLAYRAAMLRLVATYSGFQAVARPEARARCFLVGYAAGSAVMSASTRLVAGYGGEPGIARKLNEPDDACGLRSGEFDRIRSAVLSARNTETFERMNGYFQTHRRQWREEQVLPGPQFDAISERIDGAVAAVRTVRLNRSHERLEGLIGRVRRDVYSPVYDAQSVISTLIGDTRMVKRPPFITHAQVMSMQDQLQPGDILLERRNWFMSNAFLPGFWPHAALYIGDADDLEKLGLVTRRADGSRTSSDPAIRDRMGAYLATAHDGQPHTVIESVSEGVIFSSLTESMGADYVAVLRPRLSDTDKVKAIARAFAHVGKPYDFEFDFFSSDKLVCTELVYRSYEGLLNFELVRIMGRDTLPALEICKKFASERGTDDRELDFVMFLDAVPQRGSARLASEDEFCASAHRPRGFNE